MRIALVQPYSGQIVSSPLGISYISAYLRKYGYDSKVFDLQIKEANDVFEEEIMAFKPKVVGLSAMTPQITEARKLAAKLKKVFGDEVLIILGGVHASILSAEVCSSYKEFDAFCMGEGESVMLQLCRNLEENSNISHEELIKKTGLIPINGSQLSSPKQLSTLASFEDIPWPHDEYDFDYYLNVGQFRPTAEKYVGVLAQRGCPFQCRFCAANRSGIKWRTREPAQVRKELEYVRERGGEGAWFYDSTFMTKRSWTEAMCHELAPMDFPWTVYGRVDRVDYELLKLMKESGCHSIYFGAESGSQRILDYYNKNTTVEQVVKAFHMAKDVGIKVTASFILGAPIERKADLQKTYDLLKRLSPDYYTIGILTPLPGSKLYDEYKEQGHVFDYDNLFMDKAHLPTEELTIEDLNEAYRYLKSIRPKY
ncbi:MAG: radical SAM protein [bacterium]